MPAADVATIAPNHAFAQALAAGLWAEAGEDPAALARMLVLLPTRRATRVVATALLQASNGKAAVLPRLATLGDIDEDLAFGFADASDDLALPPSLPARARLAFLTRFLHPLQERLKPGTPLPETMRLARSLADVFDEMQLYRIDRRTLDQAVPDNLAIHWQKVFAFLQVATRFWPEDLARRGLIDPVERRVLLLDSLSERWAREQPRQRIIAAGSTGTQPPTARLLATIARLPGGTVLLPGFDPQMDEALIEAVAAEPSHPQHAMLDLVRQLGLKPDDVRNWPHGTPASAPARSAAVALAMLPGPLTQRWRDRRPPAEAWSGVSMIEAATPSEEAATIALAIRHQLETPGRTVALVTPDRALARRVSSAVARFGVVVDDSAGEPLRLSSPGTFLMLLAECVVHAFAPVPLLALLKHPLTGLGLDRPSLVRAVRRLDIHVLRGARPAPGLAGLRQAVPEKEQAWLLPLIDRLDATLQPFCAALSASTACAPRQQLAAHLDAAEALATTPDSAGALRLWAGEAGRTAAAAMVELDTAWAELPDTDCADYAALFAQGIDEDVVRRPYGSHARVFLWGALEARLQQADCMILAGLNDDIWPPATAPDPWLNAGLRTVLGLPPVQRRTGQSAHDLVQALGAPQVLLTRARRDAAGPKIPSRLWLRLAAIAGDALTPAEPYRAWAAALDSAKKPVPAARPRPAPPAAVRPRTISVTQIESLVRDPFAYYARHLMDLEVLEPLDAEPSVAQRGIDIHQALEHFYGLPKAERTRDRLLEIFKQDLAAHLERPGVAALWWPHLENTARWLVDHQAAWFQTWQVRVAEAKGRLERSGIVVTGRADRIDMDWQGKLAIIDYKLGTAPEAKEVRAGYSPQLPLLALIAKAGGFTAIGARDVAAVRYWSLARNDGEFGKAVDPCAGDKHPPLDTLMRQASGRLDRVIGHYLLSDAPFVAKPNPALVIKATDYDLLARLDEWFGREAPDG